MNILATEVLPYPLQIIFIAAIGLALGSFGTMILYRLPRRESMMGRSQCTKCNQTLHWYDLVPIFSFLLLGGKCHYCNASISWRYPFIEGIIAFLLVMLFVRSPGIDGITLLLLGIAMYCLVLIAFYDFDTQKIPDVFVIVLLLAAIFERVFFSQVGAPSTMRDSFLGALIPIVFFGTLWIISNRRWIGSGDILLGSAIGLLLGVELTFLALFFAYAMGALAATMLIVLKLVNSKSAIAFGPFLASGAILAILTGEEFLMQYERLFFVLL